MPEPTALTRDYLWTWDHSTNWVLDDPGLQTWGCNNSYTKRARTYVKDYRRLTDMCAANGIGGYLIYGFVRKSHGGIEAAKEVAHYAASKGVRVMPGLGTTEYGGVCYEGDFEFNLGTFLKGHPDCAHVDAEGRKSPCGLCPTHPDVIKWMRDGAQWLMENFEIGGVNLENGDFLTCYCPRCREMTEKLGAGELGYFAGQLEGYRHSLDALKAYFKDKWITYATYSGFTQLPAGKEVETGLGFTEGHPPAFVEAFPEESIAQWTLTPMVLQEPLPLKAYLECGAPEAVYDNPNWPRGLKVPTAHSVGFVHQGSQWTGTRYSLILSTIKEACLRGAEAGLEGVVIHGEVTDRYVPWWLNYQALVHFSAHPTDDMRSFANARLAPVLGGEDAAQLFMETLARWDAGEDVKDRIAPLEERITPRPRPKSKLGAANIWFWLFHLICRPCPRGLPGFF